MPREPRPPNDRYYAQRTAFVRQGDLFRDVPLGYPFPPDAVDHTAGRRKFLSGPFEPGVGLLLTPTCSMHPQGEDFAGHYAHPHRALAPVRPVEELVQKGAIKEDALALLRRYDGLYNYVYVPALQEADLPESVALIHAPIVVHHDYLEGRRIAQLSPEASIHLKRQLAAHAGGELFSHEDFEDD